MVLRLVFKIVYKGMLFNEKKSKAREVFKYRATNS